MSKVSLSELLAQKAALEKQIADTQREERAEALSQVRALMTQYGLTLADLDSRSGASSKATGGASKVAPKYRNPATSQTWSGRGLKPNWLKAALDSGRTLADFAL
jgi:DNA-binding protein H-NS